LRTRVSTGLAIVALGALLTACGGGPATAPTTAAPAPTTAPATTTTAPAAAVDLKTASAAAGQIVVDREGKSVYFFTKDVKDSGKSACEGPCVALWPAVTTTSDTPTAEGVTGTLGTIPTADGKKQVTINGLPVYTYSLDTAAGDTKGQGFNEVWYLVSPSGEMIKGAATGSTGY
jgi:predicted lipoprotein with Yx(FWY)xxD motif